MKQGVNGPFLDSSVGKREKVWKNEEYSYYCFCYLKIWRFSGCLVEAREPRHFTACNKSVLILTNTSTFMRNQLTIIREFQPGVKYTLA